MKEDKDMANYDAELKEYAGKLRAQMRGIDQIQRLNTNGLLDADVEERLSKIREEASRLLRKLENNEFEISIVGLEKAGKSSFANALMGNDILPSKEARCTYTSTSIRYGENKAQVCFFSREQFANAFQKRLSKLGIEHSEAYTYEQLTLENYRRLYETISQEKKALYGGTINEDIEAILKYKDSIRQYVGQGPRVFAGNQVREEEFKKFIENPQYAIAVKEITLCSDQLENMKNAIIYDVPGFDSPTQMHKKQTRDKMEIADAIILIASAFKPSFTGPVVDIFRETDSDGLKYGDKLFVYANMADRADNLNDNVRDICNELKKYNIMNSSFLEERVIPGSAKASLQAKGKISGTDAMEGLKRVGIEDGINCIKEKLEQYNKTYRFEVLKGRVNRLQSEIRKVFDGRFEENGYQEFDSSLKVSELATRYLDESRQKIKRGLEDFRADFKLEYAPETLKMTNKMKEDVIDELGIDKFQVTDEEFERARKENSIIVNIDILKDVDKIIRDKKYMDIYNEFSKGIINIANQEHESCDKVIENIFIEGLGLTKDNPYYEDLRKEIENYIFKHKELISGEGYYKSLVERFSIDLFETVMKCSYGDMSRWYRFAEAKENFYGLSMYSENYDNDLSPAQQPMLYYILFHDESQKKNRVNVRKVMQFVEGIMEIGPHRDIARMIRKVVDAKGEDAVNIVKNALERVEKYDDNTRKIEFAQNALESIVDNLDEEELLEIPISKKSYEDYFSDKSDKSLDDVRNDIDKDICILQEVLGDTVIKAICMEKPFLALEIQFINNLQENIKGDEYRQFIVNNISKICVEEYSDLRENDQKKMAYEKMMEAIKDILDEMGNSENIINKEDVE